MTNITRWSYSRLGTYESCPKKAYYKYIEQLPETQHPAAARGTHIHGLAEDYIVGTIKELPKELRLFSDGFEKLREDYLAEKVFVEQDWAFDKFWESAPWTGDNTWGRYKIDAFFKDGDYGKAIDFKTYESLHKKEINTPIIHSKHLYLDRIGNSGTEHGFRFYVIQ